MLYALVLVVTTTTVQPVLTGAAMGYAGRTEVGTPLVTNAISQQIIGYYRTERGCLGASLKRAAGWPDLLPGQTITGLCVEVEIPAGGAILGG